MKTCAFSFVYSILIDIFCLYKFGNCQREKNGGGEVVGVAEFDLLSEQLSEKDGKIVRYGEYYRGSFPFKTPSLH